MYPACFRLLIVIKNTAYYNIIILLIQNDWSLFLMMKQIINNNNSSKAANSAFDSADQIRFQHIHTHKILKTSRCHLPITVTQNISETKRKRWKWRIQLQKLLLTIYCFNVLLIWWSFIIKNVYRCRHTNGCYQRNSQISAEFTIVILFYEKFGDISCSCKRKTKKNANCWTRSQCLSVCKSSSYPHKTIYIHCILSRTNIFIPKNRAVPLQHTKPTLSSKWCVVVCIVAYDKSKIDFRFVISCICSCVCVFSLSLYTDFGFFSPIFLLMSKIRVAFQFDLF